MSFLNSRGLKNFGILASCFCLLLLYNNCGGFFNASSLPAGTSSVVLESKTSSFESIVINEPELAPHTKVSGNGQVDVVCSEPNKELAEGHASPLTQLEVGKSISSVLGVTVDTSVYSRFDSANLVDFPTTHLSSLELLSKEVSAQFIASLSGNKNRYWSCDFTASCTKKLVESLPTYVWRKKLSPAETTIVKKLVENYPGSSATENKLRVTHLIEFLIKAPQFHLKNAMLATNVEIAAVDNLLELASRIHFALFYSAPSYPLVSRVLSGDIGNRDQLHSFFISELDKESIQKEFVKQFFGQWFGFKGILADSGKFGTEVKKTFAQKEYQRFLDLFRNNQPLKKIVAGESEDETLFYSKVFAFNTYKPPLEGEPENTGIVQRGLYVMSNLLCMNTPAGLSPAVEAAIAAVSESKDFPVNGTNIEQAAFHRGNQVCNACHQYIDNLAIGVEPVDSFGNIRTHYPNKVPVDISLDPNTNQEYELGSESFSNTDEYTQLVAKSIDFKSCFSKRIHGRLLPNPGKKVKPCLITDLFKSRENIGLKDLVVNFIKSDLMNYRKKPKL